MWTTSPTCTITTNKLGTHTHVYTRGSIDAPFACDRRFSHNLVCSSRRPGFSCSRSSCSLSSSTCSWCSSRRVRGGFRGVVAAFLVAFCFAHPHSPSPRWPAVHGARAWFFEVIFLKLNSTQFHMFVNSSRVRTYSSRRGNYFLLQEQTEERLLLEEQGLLSAE